jgi:hypothetical protein
MPRIQVKERLIKFRIEGKTTILIYTYTDNCNSSARAFGVRAKPFWSLCSLQFFPMEREHKTHTRPKQYIYSSIAVHQQECLMQVRSVLNWLTNPNQWGTFDLYIRRYNLLKKLLAIVIFTHFFTI